MVYLFTLLVHGPRRLYSWWRANLVEDYVSTSWVKQNDVNEKEAA